ncbi:CoA pyrophosphatase [Shewanella avicenniae]|uniref:CoA pyrophosphatase n=1 Tax=Shewanella avicenniae TaxID=2814294 RepID=A0ABX7QVD5_9GAMM|nr:CoA pyrophosphatase [Shewanella avicenniae]
MAELRTHFLLSNNPQQRVVNTKGISLRSAAVLMAFSETPDGVELLLTLRPDHLKAHPGQIAFPGGKPEPQDSSMVHTALREAWEEVALAPEQVEVLGVLPLHNTLTGFSITPVVGIIDKPFTPSLDAQEVSESFTVPLSFLMAHEHRHTLWLPRSNHLIPITFIPYQQRLIWGATAAIIDTLCRQLSKN